MQKHDSFSYITECAIMLYAGRWFIIIVNMLFRDLISGGMIKHNVLITIAYLDKICSYTLNQTHNHAYAFSYV